MTLQTGATLPSVMLKTFEEGRLQKQDTMAVFKGKKIVLFAVVGAFTPTCSDDHLPGYVRNLAAFQNLGIDIVCMSVNDPFVMKAWATAYAAHGLTTFADGNGDFTKALGLEMDASNFGMGLRSHRFAFYAEDGVIKYLAVEKPGAFEVSGAEAMLAAIRNLAG